MKIGVIYEIDCFRMTEVINLLQSSIPVTINLTQRPEVSDHDFIEEQEKYLYAISTRTMALPIARYDIVLFTILKHMDGLYLTVIRFSPLLHTHT